MGFLCGKDGLRFRIVYGDEMAYEIPAVERLQGEAGDDQLASEEILYLLESLRRLGDVGEGTKVRDAQSERRRVDHAIGDDGLGLRGDGFACGIMQVGVQRGCDARALDAAQGFIAFLRERLQGKFNVCARR